MSDEIDEIIDENKDGKISMVESIRHSMRPFLVFWFSVIYAVVILYGLLNGNLEAKEAIRTVEGIILLIIGYHFGKPTKIEK